MAMLQPYHGAGPTRSSRLLTIWFWRRDRLLRARLIGEPFSESCVAARPKFTDDAGDVWPMGMKAAILLRRAE
jgi:hypothetical protein